MEIILRICAVEKFFSLNILFSFMFSLFFAGIFYLICTMFKPKANAVITSILLVILAFIYYSQIIYFKFFKTFYTLYSASNSSQVFEFWKDILSLTLKNCQWVILLLIPFLLVAILGKKFLPFEKSSNVYKLLLGFSTILCHILIIAVIQFGSRDQYSPYDLYYKSSFPVLSVDKLGLFTTMRLDLQRLAFNWAPSVTASAEEASENIPEPVTETYPEEKPLDDDKNTVPKKITEYNTMNIDFSKLISEEKNETIKNMHKYFQGVQPTEKNEYTGKYKGYNLILITAESFSPYAVRQDVTPTLYKLVHEGYNFTNFYNPIWGVSTSDGEYVALTSLIPKSGVWSFEKSGSIYMPFVMGNQLKTLNYKANAYHNHSYTYYKRNISHPNMGYDYKAVGHGLEVKKTWPESDIEMMEKTIPEYIGNQPFHTYYMTVSGHMLYTFTGNSMAAKNKSYVQDLPYSEPGKAYIAAQIELDRALEYLLKKLEEAGIADKTLIALSPDHYPYGLENKYIDELAGHTVERNFELYKSNFILYTKGMTPVTIDKPCSSLDIIPTLSNLLGLDYDSRLLMGRDIFSNSDPLVVFLNKSFITNKGRYDSTTKVFTPVEGASVEEDYIKKVSSIVDNKFYYSAKILDTNYYKKALGK